MPHPRTNSPTRLKRKSTAFTLSANPRNRGSASSSSSDSSSNALSSAPSSTHSKRGSDAWRPPTKRKRTADQDQDGDGAGAEASGSGAAAAADGHAQQQPHTAKSVGFSEALVRGRSLNELRKGGRLESALRKG